MLNFDTIYGLSGIELIQHSFERICNLEVWLWRLTIQHGKGVWILVFVIQTLILVTEKYNKA